MKAWPCCCSVNVKHTYVNTCLQMHAHTSTKPTRSNIQLRNERTEVSRAARRAAMLVGPVRGAALCACACCVCCAASESEEPAGDSAGLTIRRALNGDACVRCVCCCVCCCTGGAEMLACDDVREGVAAVVLDCVLSVYETDERLPDSSTPSSMLRSKSSSLLLMSVLPLCCGVLCVFICALAGAAVCLSVFVFCVDANAVRCGVVCGCAGVAGCEGGVVWVCMRCCCTCCCCCCTCCCCCCTCCCACRCERADRCVLLPVVAGVLVRA
jgi:hypothetical protein